MEQDINSTPTQDPFPKASAMESSHTHQIGKGVVVGIIIFATIFIVALYVATSQVKTPIAVVPQNDTTLAVPDAATTALTQQGTSDTVADIEADLNATDLSSLDDTSKI